MYSVIIASNLCWCVFVLHVSVCRSIGVGKSLSLSLSLSLYKHIPCVCNHLNNRRHAAPTLADEHRKCIVVFPRQLSRSFQSRSHPSNREKHHTTNGACSAVYHTTPLSYGETPHVPWREGVHVADEKVIDRNTASFLSSFPTLFNKYSLQRVNSFVQVHRRHHPNAER